MSDKLKKSLNGLFSKIETEEQALKIIRDTAYGFYFVVVLGLVLGLLVEQLQGLIFDAVLIAALTVLVHRLQSRVAAVLLMLLMFAELGITLHNKMYPHEASGGGNVLLAVIMTYCGVRALQATLRYHALTKGTAS